MWATMDTKDSNAILGMDIGFCMILHRDHIKASIALIKILPCPLGLSEMSLMAHMRS